MVASCQVCVVELLRSIQLVSQNPAASSPTEERGRIARQPLRMRIHVARLDQQRAERTGRTGHLKILTGGNRITFPPAPFKGGVAVAFSHGGQRTPLAEIIRWLCPELGDAAAFAPKVPMRGTRCSNGQWEHGRRCRVAFPGACRRAHCHGGLARFGLVIRRHPRVKQDRTRTLHSAAIRSARRCNTRSIFFSGN